MSDSTTVMKKPEFPFPGVYFCGQDALMFADHLAAFIDNKEEGLSQAICVQLLETLRQCKVDK